MAFRICKESQIEVLKQYRVLLLTKTREGCNRINPTWKISELVIKSLTRGGKVCCDAYMPSSKDEDKHPDEDIPELDTSTTAMPS